MENKNLQLELNLLKVFQAHNQNSQISVELLGELMNLIEDEKQKEFENGVRRGEAKKREEFNKGFERGWRAGIDSMKNN